MLLAGLTAAPGPVAALPRSPAAAALPVQPVTHGPFEILPGVRSVSTGAFPNQGGNPFARRPVSEFQLRHRGQRVTLPGGADRWWRILRLEGAPRPALLLVTTGFVLATEDAAGRLQLQPLTSQSSSLAEVQWLDAHQGQPGPVQGFGIEAVADADAGTRLAGGRWLRIGSRSILDVGTLTVHPVEPWVPIVPGVPVTSLSRDGDTVRAFSPGQTAYVLAASGYDHGQPGRPPAHGLLVVSLGTGQAVELRLERRRFRFAEPDDLTPAWIDHHFTWQRDAAGGERLVPRPRFEPWPWRVRVQSLGGGRMQLEIPRIDASFVPVIAALLRARPEARVAEEPGGGALAVTLDGCSLSVQAFDRDSPDPASRRIGIWPTGPDGRGAASPACRAAMAQLAERIDAELATGRHDGRLQLGRTPAQPPVAGAGGGVPRSASMACCTAR